MPGPERRHADAVAGILAGYDRLKKLADGRVEMVMPGHAAEVTTRFPASTKGLEGISVRPD